MDHFALGGFIIAEEYVDGILEAHLQLVTKYNISYPLHSTKIRTRRAEFSWLQLDNSLAEQFHNDLHTLVSGIPGHATACIVHRPGYNQRYANQYGQERWMLCKSVYAIVVERAAKFARMHGRKLKVFLEESGRVEDRAVRTYHQDLLSQGTYFDPERSRKYRPLTAGGLGETLYKNPTFKTKKLPQLQLADLIVYTLAKGAYEPSYRPYKALGEAGKLIDNVLSLEDRPHIGIKHYCFEMIGQIA